jgi:hypothetical protein
VRIAALAMLRIIAIWRKFSMGDLIAFKPKRRAMRAMAAFDGSATVVIFTGVRQERADNLEYQAAKARKTQRVRKVSENYPRKGKRNTGAGKRQ